jgi:hypothetical protein
VIEASPARLSGGLFHQSTVIGNGQSAMAGCRLLIAA